MRSSLPPVYTRSHPSNTRQDKKNQARDPLTLPQFTLQGTNTYLIGTGPSLTLVDAGQGEPGWPANIQNALSSSSSAGARISTVLLTHWHADHTGGMPDLYALAPDAHVSKMRPSYLGHGDNAARLQRLSASGALRNESWSDIADGQAFVVEGGLVLRALHCPGHTVDHMAFVLEREGIPVGFFTGDNVLGMGTTVFEDLGAYMSSLGKMRAALPDGDGGGAVPAYPGHGPHIPDARAKIGEYIAHRQARERQVLRVLGEEGLTSGQITGIMYKEVPKNLHEAAERGVGLILGKLEGDGRVRRDSVDESVWRSC